MSRVGIKPISIPDGVEVKIEENSGRFKGQRVIVKGPLGEAIDDFRNEIAIKIEGRNVVLKRKDESKFTRSLHGLYRTLIKNMIDGVLKYFEKELEIVGIGYRAEVQDHKLTLHLGVTHPYIYEAPEGITLEVTDKVNVKVKGINKQLVGLVAAKIRSFAKPEPYKGKGVKYKDEYVRRKAGKVAKVSSGAEK